MSDVLIIGGGPAGLAAAAELGRAGLSVMLVERAAETGGVPRDCAHSPFGMREFRRILGGAAYARRLTAQALAAGAVIRTATTVTAIAPGPVVTLSSDSGVEVLRPTRVLLATGTREATRAQRLAGGTKPAGVMTTGALQALAGLPGTLPFSRPLIVGTELVAFSALMTCLGAGMRPAAMITPDDWVAARWPAALFPRLRGVPLLRQTRLVAIHGVHRVAGVDLAAPSGAVAMPQVDAVIFTGDFRPETALCRLGHLELDPASRGPVVDNFGRCSDPAFFAAGNLLRPVETAGHCWSEGRAVARSILRDLRGGLPSGAEVRLRPGPGVKYCVPQRILADAQPAFAKVQLRVTEPQRDARLQILAEGKVVGEQSLSARPERRILVAPPTAPGGVEIRVAGKAQRQAIPRPPGTDAPAPGRRSG